MWFKGSILRRGSAERRRVFWRGVRVLGRPALRRACGCLLAFAFGSFGCRSAGEELVTSGYDNNVLTVSADKTAKVWDILEDASGK
uniref:Uncharacterized protein n=1 Tax=Leersia perrieri TaxID=77586 RepID=A0A0D9UW18_9ORYZ